MVAGCWLLVAGCDSACAGSIYKRMRDEPAGEESKPHIIVLGKIEIDVLSHADEFERAWHACCLDPDR